MESPTPPCIIKELPSDISPNPWVFRFARDRLAWVTLNGSEPLTCHIPKPHGRPEKRIECGRLQWEWSISPDYDHLDKPWRSYIPLRDEWVREGSQGWVFLQLNPNKLFDPSSATGHFQIHPELKTHVPLTYRAIQLICDAVNQIYQLRVPAFVTDLPQINWVNEEYADLESLSLKVWDARRALLELYGWVSYHLHRDLQPWRSRNWDEHFVDLVHNRLCFLTAPKRGCIIDPASISTEEVIKLVRDDVPIHYQWKPLQSPLLVDLWPDPSPAAARFDPHKFPIAYNYAAYQQAGGEYNESAKERAILGTSSAMGLGEVYLRHPRARLFDLPIPKDHKRGAKKDKIRFFVRDHVGAELTEISKNAMTRLLIDEEGDIIEREHPSGDMKLLTLHPPMRPTRLHLTNLATFFSCMSKDVPADAPEPLDPSHSQQAQTCPAQAGADDEDAVSLGEEPENMAIDESAGSPIQSTGTFRRTHGFIAPSQSIAAQYFAECGFCNLDADSDGSDIVMRPAIPYSCPWSPGASGQSAPPLSPRQSLPRREPSCHQRTFSRHRSPSPLRRTSSPGWRSRARYRSRSPRRRSITRRRSPAPLRSRSPRRRSPVARWRSPITRWRLPSSHRSLSPRRRSPPRWSPTPWRSPSPGFSIPRDVTQRDSGRGSQSEVTTSVIPIHMARRDVAIAYIQSSFPTTRTHTAFASPVVNVNNTEPAPIPDTIRRGGQLTVPASTELRIRYWHLVDPQLSVPDLLTRCLIKGLPYSISLPLVTPDISPPAIRHSDSRSLIQQTRNEKVSVGMVKKYFSNVQMVLRRPHAYKFLEYGGLIWRIVRQYGSTVYANAFIGPAAALDGHNSYNGPVTVDEIQMLLGVTTNNNSFWPYPEWYEKSNRYNGEWTTANEAWFVQHAKDIQYARDGSLRGGRMWQNNIRIHTAEIASDPAISGTMAHASACCSHLVTEWPELWDGFDIACLK
jgi:hypothetical protein